MRIGTTLSHRVEWCVESNTSVCVDGVAGSSLQSMVDTVDNAGVLLVCISRKFTESPRCRTGQEISCRLVDVKNIVEVLFYCLILVSFVSVYRQLTIEFYMLLIAGTLSG